MKNSNTYYKDVWKIEDALLPSLFQYLIMIHLQRSPEYDKDYQVPMEVLEARIAEAFFGVSKEKETKLRNRTARIAKKVTEYFIKNKFDSRKGFLTLTAWIEALEKAGAVIIEGDFKELINDMNDIIRKGYKEIENFEKIDLSAINHVEKIHKLVQEEGYFV